MHPLIDSIFRNQASESSAMAYLQNRHEEQERAEARVRAHLLKYHVDVCAHLPYPSTGRVDEDADREDSCRAAPEHV